MTALASDLATLIPEINRKGKSVFSCIVDEGPDHAPEHLLYFIVYGQLCCDEQLDTLIVTTYAPGFSAYNRVEHASSLLSCTLKSARIDLTKILF